MERLSELSAQSESDLQPHLEHLELELETPRSFSQESRRGISQLVLYAATLSWRPAPGIAAEGENGEGLSVGDERPGRFRAVLSPERQDVELEVEVDIDVKRSLVTLHTVNPSTIIVVDGQQISGKLSIPVSDHQDDGGKCALRLGRPLSEALERVVSIG